MRAYLAKVLHITGNMKKKLPWVLALYFVSLGLELAGLSLIIPFISVLQNPDNLDKIPFWSDFSQAAGIQTSLEALLVLSGIIFAVYLIKTLLNIHIQTLILRFSYELQANLREKFSGLFLSAPYLFHTRRRSNDIINMLQSHISQFSKAVVGSLLRIAGEGMTLIAIFLFLLVKYPIPTVTAFILLTLFAFFYDLVVKKRLHHAGQELLTAHSDMIRNIRQGVESMKEARVLGCNEHFHQEIAESSLRASTVNAQVAILQMYPRYILEFLVVTVVILPSVILSLTGNTGSTVIDGLAVFAVAAIRLLPTANQIIGNAANLRYSGKAVEELYTDLRELNKEESGLKPGTTTSESYETLSLQNITFAYPGSMQPVLDDISLDLKKGEIVGIAGPSGAGKTTLVDIILGLIEPDSGRFILNGKEISAQDWAAHRLAAYIPQNPVMLDDTVARNIALGQQDKTVNDNLVSEALDKAQLKKVVSALPQQESTVIGEDAVFLSGGQRQRLALARSFYFNREIIILDEATSAVDRETENEILQAIKELKGNATVLIISHSDHPLQICDRVCYLSQGKIVEQPEN